MKWSKAVGCRSDLAMVAWNALILATYQLRGVGENDLPEAPEFLMPINALHETGYPAARKDTHH